MYLRRRFLLQNSEEGDKGIIFDSKVNDAAAPVNVINGGQDVACNNEKEITLRHVYKQLPEKITSSMKENLSGPLAFLALLHVATEENLMLVSSDDLGDITIKSED